MKKMIFLALFLLLALPGFCSEGTDAAGEMAEVMIPKVITQSIAMAPDIRPTYYPTFLSVESNDPTDACPDEGLWRGCSGKMVDYINGGCYPEGAAPEPQLVLLATQTIDFNVLNLEKRLKTLQLFVEFVHRVFGEEEQWGLKEYGLCDSFREGFFRRIRRKSEGGSFKTAIFVNGEKMGETAISIPGAASSLRDIEAGDEKTVEQPPRPPYDPTGAGAVLLEPNDFPEGMLPEVITIQLYGTNYTDLNIVTEDGAITTHIRPAS